MDKIEQAKAILKEAGYYTGNLWHINDVKEDYDITDDEAHDVLSKALNNEGTFDQIWTAIKFYADDTTKI